MANAISSQQDLQSDQWAAILTTLTREFRGAHGRVEVSGTELGYVVPTEGRQFEGISADNKDGERVVWISFAGGPDGHLTHGIHKVSSIHMLTPDGTARAAIEVRSDDGSKTILTLDGPGSHALPPPAR